MTNATRQPDLFAGQPPADQEFTPERMAPVVRPRLAALLAEARAAERLPWDARTAAVNAVVFHQMARWLPEAERDRLRAEFRAELARLGAQA
ncbi:hypothetical protein GCM10010964_30230 [Caldovatus sediminis]|uniref:Uncharacterized protein n=1 Tax=Caldovatus sediminis TaxID=2041189 RepID=A0A8J3ED30_9PROT|nr:hypothetical protein [Caldovatus sediminis]GGG40579.1 hypothetical protein GCM10010964_30230 [Caldovatus sediminis]